MAEVKELFSALVELKEDQASALVDDLISNNVAATEILEQMRRAMTEVGERFGAGTIFLTEMILAAEIFGNQMKKIEPLLIGEGGGDKGQVVIATVKGDVHDIGKNVVVAMLRGTGFQVHDLGVDVPADRIIAKLKETGSTLLGLSGLLTTSFTSMKETIDALTEAGLTPGVKTMIGGGPTDERVLAHTGADAVGYDAQQAVLLAAKYLEK
jgi:5-methyltetrahydrofolate--homocysteine methyltransferase